MPIIIVTAVNLKAYAVSISFYTMLYKIFDNLFLSMMLCLTCMTIILLLVLDSFYNGN